MDLHRIISLVPGIIYQFRLRPDGSTCVPYASEAIREIYRLDPEEIREDASQAFIHVHPDDLESHLASIKASARDLTPWQHEYRLKFDDGTVRWLFGNALPQREADGSTLWHGFITDITERKAAEEMLRFHSEILLNLSEGIFLIRASDGVIVFTNPQFERMFGYGLGELLGKHMSIVNAPGENSPEAVATAIMSELARTGVWSGEVRNIRKDGTTFWCHVNVLAFVHPKFGKVWVSVHEDVTERKNVEDKLRQTKKRYDFATAVGKVGTWDWNPVTSDLIWSDETFRLMGLTPGTVTPSYELFLGLAHPDDRIFLDSAVRAALHDKKTYTLDCRFILGGGEVLVCNMVGKVEFDAKGQPIRMLGTIQDITGRKQIEDALRESEASQSAILNNSPYLTWLKDSKGRYLKINKAYADYARLKDPQQVIGKTDFELWPKELAEKYRADDAGIMDSRQQKCVEEPSLNGDEMHWVETFKTPVIDESGNVLGITGFTRDITERKQAEAELRIAATAFESQDGMIVADAHNVILRVNHAFTEITGYTAEEAIGQTPRLLRSGRHDAAFYAAMWESIRCTEAWHGEIWSRRKNGEEYPEQLTITAVKGDHGETTHYVATLRDITERKAAEEEIHNLAFYDALTKLPNRRLLNDRLRQAMAASKRSGLYGALMFLDLDNFKPLNDTHGHDVGDLLLVEVAHRIASCVREVDTVARFGGDEFVVMLSELDAGNAESTAQAGNVAEKIRIILAEPYVLKFQPEGNAETIVEHHCTSSIGVTLFINHKAGPEDILKWADRAMYQAKEGGRNRVHFYGS